MQQPPGPPPAPDWLANPSDYQAPQPASQYDESQPASELNGLSGGFVSSPAATQAQAPIFDEGFSFRYGDKKITGWHAAALIAAGLALWTGLQIFTLVSSQAEWDQFTQAPYCAANAINDSCIARLQVRLQVFTNSSGCDVYAHAVNGSGDWHGTFTTDACNGLKRSLFVMGNIWRDKLVRIERFSGDDWSTDSAVGAHATGGTSVLLVLAFDAFFAFAVVLAVIYRLMNRRKRPAKLIL